MTLTLNPPLHQAELLHQGLRHPLRALLSVDPFDDDRPFAITQKVAMRGSTPLLLGQFTLHYWRGGKVVARGLHDADADHQLPALRLALRLAEDRILPGAIQEIGAHERLLSDPFTMDDVNLDVTHLPHGGIISWDMSEWRLGRLLKTQHDTDGIRWNNPMAALGTLVVREPASNHDRLETLREIIDCQTRLELLLQSKSKGMVLMGQVMRHQQNA